MGTISDAPGWIGEYAVVARQDRASSDRYLGTITNGDARTLKIPFDFLVRRRRYEAQTYADGAGAHWRTTPERTTINKRIVTATDIFDPLLASGGGPAIWLAAMN